MVDVNGRGGRTASISLVGTLLNIAVHRYLLGHGGAQSPRTEFVNGCEDQFIPFLKNKNEKMRRKKYTERSSSVLWRNLKATGFMTH